MSDVPAFTPVFLLTGFLGSGKTTLLGRLLRHPDLSDTAVLINEFGEIGLDHHLVERVDETVVLLKSGCLCCTVRGELAEAIRDLESRRARGVVPPFRRLVIETTGLADPLPALTTITADPVLRHHFRVGAVVTTVDAVNIRAQLAHQPESVKQVVVADRLLMTKADLCDPGSLAGVRTALRALNPEAPLLDAAAAGGDPMSVLAERPPLGALSSRLSRFVTEPAIHGDDLASFALVVEEAIDWTAFGLWLSLLLNRHGERVLRVKGLLNLVGTETPVAIHGVQQLVHVPVHLAAWPDGDQRSRIVFITRGLDPAAITRSIRAFGVLAERMPAGVAA